MLRIGVLAPRRDDASVDLRRVRTGRVAGCIVIVISNNNESGALRWAAAAGMDTLHVSSVTPASSDALVTDRGRDCSEIACSQRSMTRVSPSPVRRCTSWIPSTTPASPLARVQACEREAVVKTSAARASAERAFG
jgi:hypothetical protein